MLSIAVIVLLGFSLYYYIPRKLEMETRFQHSLFWAKIGVSCFIGQIIWMLAISNFLLFLMLNALYESPLEGFIAYVTCYPLYPFSLMSTFPTDMSLLFMFFFLCPLVSVGLTHVKLIKPLGEKKAPSQNWFHFIGLFSATCMGWFLCDSLSHISGLERVLQALPVALFFFSILLVGIFAVETSGHRLISASS